MMNVTLKYGFFVLSLSLFCSTYLLLNLGFAMGEPGYASLLVAPGVEVVLDTEPMDVVVRNSSTCSEDLLYMYLIAAPPSASWPLPTIIVTHSYSTPPSTLTRSFPPSSGRGLSTP